MYYRCIQREMLEDLFGEYAWVDVPHPFDIMDFCRRLFFCWIRTSNMGQDFVSECSKLMHQKRRFLLVIDGLQSTNDWNSILQARLPWTACISCIVVVTRYPTVARHCATIEDEICSIRSLRVDEMRHHMRDKIIVQQLCEVVPAGTPGQEDPEMTNEELDMLLTEEAFGIMNKCGRSPEVVGCLRSYLVSKQGDAAKIAALRHLNDNFMQELRANPDLGSLLRVFTSMHSNIHTCPQVIKKCLFYLSIFHQGRNIRRDRLVRRWITEGYSEGIDSSSMVVYTETKLFHKLAELGIITQPAAPQSSSRTGTMRMSSCQVNSLFLEYITLCETEERIFLPLEVTVLEGGRNPSTEHVGQHLAIRKWTGEKAVFDCLDFSWLRSLTVTGEWQPFFVSDMMLVLRVLDLEGTTSNLRDGDLKQIVEQLPRLKFLSLRGCNEITRLPRSMGGLRQLQALDVRGTCVVRLPGSIVKLHKLQYLHAGDGQGGVRVPRGIGALKALHTLGAIDVSSSSTGVAILNELHRLQQLRKLHVSGIIKRHNSLCVCVACFVSGGQASSGSSIRFPTNSFGELKVLEIACSPGIHVQFAQGAVPKLEKVKLYCQDGSTLQFSGLKFLRSLKQILLKGPGCNAIRNSLPKQLNLQIPNNQIALTIAQGHGSQPEPGPAQGNQEMPA
ncbi:disease resistance protein Pik-2-like [Miscanthus floridulus]|uniref:disease resistance protein Pik-2-like n=1 Tax=Miscanthus floridulus TaxID=154761 RepID=UPI0034595104